MNFGDLHAAENVAIVLVSKCKHEYFAVFTDALSTYYLRGYL
jgi:hypothetical protein